MAEQDIDILSQAVANSATVLSLPSAGMLRHHKTRFLSEGADGVWIESVPQEHALINELISSSQSCGVSFKTGDKKISFTCKLLKLNDAFQMNAETVVPAVLFARPEQVKAVQRRNNYRVRVRAESTLSVKVWRIPEHARLKDKPVRQAELSVELRDISLGGVGVTILPKEGEPPKALPDERVRVLIKNGEEEEFLIEGRIRSAHSSTKTGSIVTGIQFKKLQDGLEGRQALAALTKILGAMNMEEVRLNRMGIA